MDRAEQYPLVSPQSSLQAQLQALALLELRVQGLTQRTSWDVQVPFAPKAAAKGKLVHTNDLKVDLGEGVWVEMTAQEAVAYLQRQRHRIIDGHMRIADRGVLQRSQGIVQSAPVPANMLSSASASQQWTTPSPTAPISSASTSQAQTKALTPVPEIFISKPSAQPSTPVSTPKQVAMQPTLISNSSPAAQSNPNSDIIPSKDDLVSLVEQLALQEKQSSGSSSGSQDGMGQVTQDGTVGPSLLPARLRLKKLTQEVLNEEGLPFLEIRETPQQGDDLTTEASSSTASSAVAEALKVAKQEREMEKERDEKYWSEDAKKRRLALLASVLGGDIDEGDDDDREAIVHEAEVTRMEAPTDSPSAGQPKSILKPLTRKKSVTFDDATKDETPALSAPTIAPPQAAIVAPKSTAAFAGFKKGFLSSPLKQEITPSPSSAPKIVELPLSDPSPIASSSSSVPSSILRPVEVPAPTPTPKKKSLFAMRKAQLTAPKTEAPTLPSATKTVGKPAPVKGSTPKLPKASTSKPMTSMKSSVVERVVEKPVFKPVKPKPAKREIESDSGTELSDYSDLEEDAMDMDQALLARQVALDYHKRRSYIPVLNEEGTVGGDEWDRETGQGRWAEDRQVRFGLPRLTGEDGKAIDVGASDLVHATELPAHLRVGKLENGQLIVAAGNDSDDSEAEEDEDVLRQREHRQLLLQAGDLRIPGDKSLGPEEIRRGMRSELEKLQPYLAKKGGVADGKGPQEAVNPVNAPGIAHSSPPTPTTSSPALDLLHSVRAAKLDVQEKPVTTATTKPATLAASYSSTTTPTSDASPAAAPAPAKKVSKFKLARAAAANQ